MGYSPRGHKESDTTEQLHIVVLPPLVPGAFGHTLERQEEEERVGRSSSPDWCRHSASRKWDVDVVQTGCLGSAEFPITSLGSGSIEVRLQVGLPTLEI